MAERREQLHRQRQAVGVRTEWKRDRGKAGNIGKRRKWRESRHAVELEFDIVILVDVNEDSYQENDHARRMLHVAMTRAAHQLWVTHTGTPSRLLPEYLGR